MSTWLLLSQRNSSFDITWLTSSHNPEQGLHARNADLHTFSEFDLNKRSAEIDFEGLEERAAKMDMDKKKDKKKDDKKKKTTTTAAAAAATTA